MGRIDTYVADEFNVSKSCDYYLFHLSSAGCVNYMHTSPDDFKLLFIGVILVISIDMLKEKKTLTKFYAIVIVF